MYGWVLGFVVACLRLGLISGVIEGGVDTKQYEVIIEYDNVLFVCSNS